MPLPAGVHPFQAWSYSGKPGARLDCKVCGEPLFRPVHGWRADATGQPRLWPAPVQGRLI